MKKNNVLFFSLLHLQILRALNPQDKKDCYSIKETNQRSTSKKFNSLCKQEGRWIFYLVLLIV